MCGYPHVKRICAGIRPLVHARRGIIQKRLQIGRQMDPLVLRRAQERPGHPTRTILATFVCGFIDEIEHGRIQSKVDCLF